MSISNLKYRHPRSGTIGFLIGCLLNSSFLIHLRRAIFNWLPFMRLASDVRNVVYLNWVVPTEKVNHLVPDGVSLWQHDNNTILSVLIYQHGNFGPAFLGPLRRLLPSPKQSNWRLYVDQVNGQQREQPTVLFFTNCMDSLLYTAGARIFSDTLPCHLALTIQHSLASDQVQTTIASGNGSSPDLTFSAKFNEVKTLPVEFKAIFSSWKSALEFLCLQDAAVSAALATNRLAFSQIDLPIQVSSAQSMIVDDESLKSNWLSSIVKDTEPLCFLIERVKFQVLSDGLIK